MTAWITGKLVSKGVNFGPRLIGGSSMSAKITGSVLEYLKVRTVTDNNCILYIGSKNTKGYSVVGPNTLMKFYKTPFLHRMVYMYHNGPIPQGLVVMHSCDNRACVNIEHLSVGTHLSNNQDMMNKGRNNQLKGEENPNSKLDYEKIEFIRRTRKIFSATLIAEVFNVHQSTIAYVRQGKNWKHTKGDK